ncbi:hypothetical protein Tco_0412605 [Tanacetum coccineum]
MRRITSRRINRSAFEKEGGFEAIMHTCSVAYRVTDGSSLGAIFNHFTGKFDLSPSSQTANKTAEQKEKSCIAAATVANKEVAAYNHFHMPSLVAYDSPELLESSSRSVHRKRTPLDDPRTSQVIPKATSKKVTASVETDHRKAVVVIVIMDTASQPLNTEPIPTNGAATRYEKTKEKGTCKPSSSEK